jgi:hypothetical protein
MFNQTQQQTLRAAVDRIIPADEFPSGWEAGVGDFLERLLTQEPRFLPGYQRGLDALEAQAEQNNHAPFATLSPDAQDALLSRTDEIFLRLLVQQVQEGFYADPGNGGNHNGIAWKMIGYRVTA